MTRFRILQSMPIVGPLLAAVGLTGVMLAMAPPALATSSYAEATGQRCATCHVGQPGQAVLTAEGQRFAAVTSHRTDPAGAWAAVVGAGTAGAPPQVQVPSQLPRTGDASPPVVPSWAPGIGVALIVLGSALTAVGRRRT